MSRTCRRVSHRIISATPDGITSLVCMSRSYINVLKHREIKKLKPVKSLLFLVFFSLIYSVFYISPALRVESSFIPIFHFYISCSIIFAKSGLSFHFHIAILVMDLATLHLIFHVIINIIKNSYWTPIMCRECHFLGAVCCLNQIHLHFE